MDSYIPSSVLKERKAIDQQYLLSPALKVAIATAAVSDPTTTICTCTCGAPCIAHHTAAANNKIEKSNNIHYAEEEEDFDQSNSEDEADEREYQEYKRAQKLKKQQKRESKERKQLEKLIWKQGRVGMTQFTRKMKDHKQITPENEHEMENEMEPQEVRGLSSARKEPSVLVGPSRVTRMFLKKKQERTSALLAQDRSRGRGQGQAQEQEQAPVLTRQALHGSHLGQPSQLSQLHTDRIPRQTSVQDRRPLPSCYLQRVWSRIKRSQTSLSRSKTMHKQL